MRLPLSKDNFATIISVSAPTMTNPDENKEAFYNQLASVLSGIPRTDKLLLIGDFNARIGKDNDKWPLVMAKHGIGKCNSNGELLLALCSEFELTLTTPCSSRRMNARPPGCILVRNTVLSPKGRRRKTQHQTRIGQLCSRSCTTQPRHILARQTEKARTGSTPTTRSYRFL